MNIGYACVSTPKQGESLKTQREALLAAGCNPEHIYADKISGAKWSRLQLDKALTFTRESDTLVVTRLDRLGRNVRETIVAIADLGDRGMNVRVLEPKLNTADPMDKVVITIVSALTEWERELLNARTREGVADARAEGRGRRPEARTGTANQEGRRQGEAVTSVARSFGVSRQTVYRELEKV